MELISNLEKYINDDFEKIHPFIAMVELVEL